MAYLVEFDKRALKDLDKLPPQVVRLILEKISLLADNPLQGPGIKRLSATLYRLEVLRVWRLVYRVEGIRSIIVLIGHRNDCYKRLKRRR